MAKISELPIVAAPTGTETVVVLDGGETRRASFGGLVDAAVAPAVAQARSFADALSTDATISIGRPPAVPLVDGSATNRAQAYFLDPVDRAGLLTSIDLFDRAAGTIEVAVFRMIDGVATRVGLSTVTTLGGNVERRCPVAEPLPVQPGDLRCLRATADGIFSISVASAADGAGYFLGPQLPFPDTIAIGAATTNLVLQLRMNVTYRRQVVTAAALATIEQTASAAQETATAAAKVAAQLTADVTLPIGRPTGAALVDASSIQRGQAYFLDAVKEAGTLVSVDLFDKAAGTAEVAVFRMIAGTLTRVGLSTVTTLGGNVERRCPLAEPLAVLPGDIVCLRATADGLYTISVSTVADGAGYFLGPPLAMPATVQLGGASTNLRMEARLNIVSREVVVTGDAFNTLKGDIADIGNAVMMQRGSPRRLLAADVRPALPSVASWVGLIAHGQSNSTGYQARPALSTVQPYANRTFAGGVGAGRAGNAYGAVATVPGMSGSKLLVEADTTDAAPGGDGSPVNGESICTTAASTFVELVAAQSGIDPASTVVFASAAGHAGYSIAKLSKGSPWYGSLIDHIAGAAELAAAAGKGYTPPVVYYVQGADDARDGQSTAYWRDAFLKLVADVNRDGLAAINVAMAAAGLPTRSTPIHFLLTQTASPYYEGTRENLAKIRQAQFECVNASPLIHFAFPEASLPPKVGDWLHYTATSQIRAGRHVGRAMKQLIVDGCEPDCVWPVSALATGTTVRVKFRVPAFPLVLDEVTFGILPDKGFKVTDATGVVPIASVAVSTRGDEIEIVLARALGASPVVNHGFDYIGSTNNHFSSANGCLRDSTPATTTIAGVTYPMWHVAPSFALPVYQVKAGSVIDPTDAKAAAPTGAIATTEQIADTLAKVMMTATERARLAATSEAFATVSDRSGYAGGWQTPGGLLGLGFRRSDLRPIFGNGGDIVGRVEIAEGVLAASKSGIEAAASGLTVAGGARSGIAFGGMFPNGQMPWHVDKRYGRFHANGRYVAGELDAMLGQIAALQAQVANPIPDYPSTDIAAWGDSLTDGGSSGDWLVKLAADIGVAAYNGGTGGQGTRAIAARAGGCPAILAAAVMIPATTAPVVVTFAGGFSPVNANRPVLFTLAGVAGQLNRDASNVLTFTRLVEGTTVNAAARTMLLPVDAATHRGRTMIVGMGRNSFRAGTGDFQAVGQIIAAIRSVLDYQSSRVRRAIVWEIPPTQIEPNGNANRAVLDSVNAAIKAAFPGEWLDIASWLRTTAPQTVGTVMVNDPFTQLGISPTAQDLADIANGVTPTTLTSDGLHFTQLAGTAIAYRIKTHMQIKGWIN